MGFLDEAKSKLTELAEQHPDQVETLSDQVLEKAGDIAASKGVGADQVQTGKDFLDGKIGS